VPVRDGRAVASGAIIVSQWKTWSRGLAVAVLTTPVVGDDSMDNRYVGE
jgi:hypothetical protein